MEDLNTIIIELLKNKHSEESVKSEEEFISDCRSIIELD
jgi:uncharacterized short protein YbdD (DUF466 family)